MKTKAPVEERWARFGPPDPAWYVHVPRGGFCASVFLIVRNRRGDYLFGQPKAHRAWPEWGCLPLWRVQQIQAENGWILPASHLLMEESPDRAAARVLRQWAGVDRGSPKFVTAESEIFRTGKWEGRGRNRRPVNHWALCFVYEAHPGTPPRPPSAWAELRFMPRAEMARSKISREHADIVKLYVQARARKAGG